MTDRLYHLHAELREFTARIVARQTTDRGPAVCLDRTAFYPTAGGQPNDTGFLNDVRVLDVWEDDSAKLWHLVERVPDGDDVTGRLDWERRFDHMQQHTGQHLLSAACVQVLSAPTIAVHMGATESHVDLETPAMSWHDAFRVEASVNQVIHENRPIDVLVVPETEIEALGLRRPPQVRGMIRVVRVVGYDAAACGGTHVERTGSVGLLKIVRIERYKSGVRVTFLAGGRALRDYQRVLRGLQAASADLSVHPDQLGEAVERLQGELRDIRRAWRSAQDELLAVAASRMVRDAEERSGVRRVVAHLPDHSFAQARALATHATGHSRTLALLAVTEGKGVRLVCRRSDDSTEIDAAQILRRAAERLGGRGGGTPAQAEGGAPPAPSESIAAALHEAVSW